MKKTKGINRVIATLTAMFMFVNPLVTFNCAEIVNAATTRQVEGLKRGLTVSAISSGTLVSWRYLGTDSADAVFKLYRDSNLIYTSNKDMPTCYADTKGSVGSNYTLEVYGDGTTLSGTSHVEYTLNYDSMGKGGYFDMTLDRPTDTSGLGATYTPNDASVADLDGDGQYELIIKWDPSNSQDNSKSGDTSNVYIDAYEFESGDATRLWRIDLGQNIRAGAHYTQFMVYDFDGDGKAEMVCKTAPSSKDGKGAYVSKASSVSAIKNASDNSTDYADANGRILSGSEYLTLFNGETGAALDTIYYEPGRGTVSDWGDNYGNRVDRFLGGVAYLDGKTPSVIMCRGYYTRSVLAAYNVSNNKLVKKWTFDSNTAGSKYAGQGNHSLAVADVDSDGYDEIVYGSMTVDHNGKGLYSTQLGHGDALHVGDFMPNRSGLEVFQVHEETFGASLRDAKDGAIIKRWTANSDTGRGVADNIIAGNNEAEFVSTADNIVYNSSGTQVAAWSDITKWNMNSLIYWDGDLEREVLDRSMIDDYLNGRIFTGQNVTYNNDSKSNMCITADIFGDWREELVAPLSDGSGVRVYATPYATDYRIYTLMHNTAYRCGVAIENVGYNQPPHVDYWLGTGDNLPSQPSVYSTLSFESGSGGNTTVTGGASHSFNDGKESSYYTITGNLSTSSGSVTYNGEEITQCLKIESSTSIVFTSEAAGTLTMVFSTASAGSTIKIDGKAYSIPSDGVLSVDIGSGAHTITKGSGSSYLFYINNSGGGTSTENSTETTTQAYVSGELTALDTGTYDATLMLSDISKFTVSGSTSATQVKINESGYVEFKVNDNANVTVTYKCGSTDTAKGASAVLNGTAGTVLAGGSGNADLTVRGLSAGTYKITATQTGGTTAQIVSINITYGTVETSTETTTVTTTTATTATTTTTRTTESTTEATTLAPVPVVLTELEKGTYDSATMLGDSSRFNVSGSTSLTQIKIKESGYVEFKVNDNANVTVTYKCGSSETAKSAAVILNGVTGTILAGGSGNADLTVTGLSAGTYRITATQTGGTTAQVVSINVTYGSPVIKGDADNNGVVEKADVTMILQYVVGIIENVTNAEAADVNEDNSVSSSDAYLIRKFINTGKWN